MSRNWHTKQETKNLNKSYLLHSHCLVAVCMYKVISPHFHSLPHFFIPLFLPLPLSVLFSEDHLDRPSLYLFLILFLTFPLLPLSLPLSLCQLTVFIPDTVKRPTSLINAHLSTQWPYPPSSTYFLLSSFFPSSHRHLGDHFCSLSVFKTLFLLSITRWSFRSPAWSNNP